MTNRAAYLRKMGKYVRWMANELGLRDWTTTVHWNVLSDGDYQAHVECTYGRKHAIITLGKCWSGLSQEERRETIVHELLHCHLDAITVQARSVWNALGKEAAGIAEDDHKDRIEWAVDGVAANIAKHYPLPPPLE